MTPSAYLPFLFQAVLAAAITRGGHRRQPSPRASGRAKHRIKDSAYECGIPARGLVHTRFSVKFFVTALLFMLFDLEVVILIPWTFVYRDSWPTAHPDPAADPVSSSACWCWASSTRSARARSSGSGDRASRPPGALTGFSACGSKRSSPAAASSTCSSTDLEGALEELLDVSRHQVPRPEAGGAAQGPARAREHDDHLPRPGRGAAARAREDAPPLRPRHRPQPRRASATTASRSNERVHLIVMLIAGETARDYLQVLASHRAAGAEPELVDSLVHAPDLDALYERLFHRLRRHRGAPGPGCSRTGSTASCSARPSAWPGAPAAATIMVFGDTFIGRHRARAWFGGTKTILVTRNPIEPGEERKGFAETIQVRSFSSQRLAQLRSADPRRAHPRADHVSTTGSAASGGIAGQQPVRHRRGRRHRARVPDAADGPCRTCCRRT